MPHRLIGWLTRLPQDWELRFRQELTKLQGTETVMMTTDSIPSFIEIKAKEEHQRRLAHISVPCSPRPSRLCGLEFLSLPTASIQFYQSPTTNDQ